MYWKLIIDKDHDNKMSKKSIVHGHVLGDMSVDKETCPRNGNIVENKHHKDKSKRDKSLDPKARASHIQKIEKLEQFEPNFLDKIQSLIFLDFLIEQENRDFIDNNSSSNNNIVK